jgi:hypothetical protein
VKLLVLLTVAGGVSVLSVFRSIHVQQQLFSPTVAVNSPCSLCTCAAVALLVSSQLFSF